ncbi:hypothetical protein ACU6VJ_17220 [Sphaerotilus sulfidivorans]
MNVRFLVVCALLHVLFFHQSTLAQEGSRFRISVDVSCDDQALKSQLTSFVNRELRALRDVDIVTTNANYKVQIVAIAVTLRNGNNVGNAVSLVISSPIGDWNWALSNTLSPESKKAIAAMLASQYSLDDHRLLVGAVDGLQQQITQVIVDFDATTLEPSRKFRQILRDAQGTKKQ